MRRPRSAWEISHPIPEATLSRWRSEKRAQRARWACANGCAWCGCPRVDGLSLCDICREIKSKNARDYRARHPEKAAAYNAARRVVPANALAEGPRDRWPAVVHGTIEV